VSFSAITRMKMEGATPLECGMVIFTGREGNPCAPAHAAAAASAKPNASRTIKRP
jgi:hypothetical protein